MFEAEKMSILERLGDRAVTVYHVGSTAIPGLKAKAEIDILIVIRSLSEIEEINAGMAALGYRVRGERGITEYLEGKRPYIDGIMQRALSEGAYGTGLWLGSRASSKAWRLSTCLPNSAMESHGLSPV